MRIKLTEGQLNRMINESEMATNMIETYRTLALKLERGLDKLYSQMVQLRLEGFISGEHIDTFKGYYNQVDTIRDINDKTKTKVADYIEGFSETDYYKYEDELTSLEHQTYELWSSVDDKGMLLVDLISQFENIINFVDEIEGDENKTLQRFISSTQPLDV